MLLPHVLTSASRPSARRRDPDLRTDPKRGPFPRSAPPTRGDSPASRPAPPAPAPRPLRSPTALPDHLVACVCLPTPLFPRGCRVPEGSPCSSVDVRLFASQKTAPRRAGAPHVSDEGAAERPRGGDARGSAPKRTGLPTGVRSVRQPPAPSFYPPLLSSSHSPRSHLSCDGFVWGGSAGSRRTKSTYSWKSTQGT